MFVPDDYYDAARWLQNSKRVIDRGSRRTMYARYWRLQLVRRSPDSIAISTTYHGDIMTFHSDGTAILAIDTSKHGYNPLYSQGMRYLIRTISGFTNVFQKNHKIYITEQDYKLTPSKIQGCRTCRSSGKVDTTCWPDACHAAYYSGSTSGTCTIHNNAQVDKHGWHYLPCEHGKTTKHTLYAAQTCYYCAGFGKREYGKKPISLMWDGSPIRIKGGNLVKKEPSELEKRIAAYVNPFD